jgi:hypothetical protein
VPRPVELANQEPRGIRNQLVENQLSPSNYTYSDAHRDYCIVQDNLGGGSKPSRRSIRLIHGTSRGDGRRSFARLVCRRLGRGWAATVPGRACGTTPATRARHPWGR